MSIFHSAIEREEMDMAPLDYSAAPMKKLVHPILLALALIALLPLTACKLAPLAAGADPFIVRAEQAQAIGYTTIDEFLKIDAANTPFLRTNAPAVHQSAEYLRAWVQDGSIQQRRWVLYLKSLDRVKLAYKAGHASSNDLVTALATVESAVIEAQLNLTAARANPAINTNPGRASAPASP